jgi:transposase InsO family protein
VIQVLGVSQRFACRVTGQNRGTQRRTPAAQTPADPDATLRSWLRDYAKVHPRWGFRRAYHDARGEGWIVNHKKIQRLWREEGLRVPQHRRRKRLGACSAPDTPTATAPNMVWPVDFQFDSTSNGRPVKIASIVDEHTRECLGGLVARSITADILINELDRIAAVRGYPKVLRSDNGPELACAAMADWPTTASPWRSSHLANRGATATSNRSTASSATNASTSTSSGRLPTPRSSSATGRPSTTTTDGTQPWPTKHRPDTLPPAPTDKATHANPGSVHGVRSRRTCRCCRASLSA